MITPRQNINFKSAFLRPYLTNIFGKTGKNISNRFSSKGGKRYISSDNKTITMSYPNNIRETVKKNKSGKIFYIQTGDGVQISILDSGYARAKKGDTIIAIKYTDGSVLDKTGKGVKYYRKGELMYYSLTGLDKLNDSERHRVN